MPRVPQNYVLAPVEIVPEKPTHPRTGLRRGAYQHRVTHVGRQKAVPTDIQIELDDIRDKYRRLCARYNAKPNGGDWRAMRHLRERAKALAKHIRIVP